MRVLIVSEFNIVSGSGYTTITRGLAAGLGVRGHDVCVMGFFYVGQEHRLPIRVVPTEPGNLLAHAQRLIRAWPPDVIVGIADISHLVGWQRLMEIKIPYAAVFLLESDPLIHPSEWTRIIDQMNAALVMTQWATKACQDMGLAARHIPIGIDTEFWRPPTVEERYAVRQRMEIEDKWAILTVCDRHQRKNLPAMMAATALVAGKSFPWPPAEAKSIKPVADWEDVCLIINTKRRPDHLGYQLWNLAESFGLSNQTIFYQHEAREGLTDVELRNLYWAADTFLLLPVAEGLGLPAMEAMACGVPVVATDTGGLAENLADGRGWLVPAEYSFIDPFGNQVRRFPSVIEAAKALRNIRHGQRIAEDKTAAALAWARGRKWDQAVDVLEEALNDIASKEA